MDGSANFSFSQTPYRLDSPMPERSPMRTSEKMLNIFPFRASLVPPAMATDLLMRSVPGFETSSRLGYLSITMPLRPW